MTLCLLETTEKYMNRLTKLFKSKKQRNESLKSKECSKECNYANDYYGDQVCFFRD